MRYSFRVARVMGIDIRVHWTFFLILVWGAWMFQGYGPVGWVYGAILFLLLFVCVTLHELGHSVVAKYFGVPVRQILLLPIGGVAMMARNPSKPLHELLIAIAGPLVNVVIIALLLIGIDWRVAVAFNPTALVRALQSGPSFTAALTWLGWMNFILIAFNMIPAFPLDGGRVLRGLLGFFMDYSRATRIAATIGQVLAVMGGLYALLHGAFLLALIAVFIFLGAGAESAAGQARTVLSTLRVGDAYNKHALSLSPVDRVSQVIDYILTSEQRDFAVRDGQDILGIVTRQSVLEHLAERATDMPVTDVMQRNWLRVESQTPLDVVRQRMAEADARIAAVYDGRRYLGLVSLEDIDEAYVVLSFIQRQGAMPVVHAAHAEPAPGEPARGYAPLQQERPII